MPGKHIEAYKELERCRSEGLIRSIGVSNYTLEDYLELKDATTVPPAVNQIEFNPFLYRRETVDFFQKEGVLIQSYRSLRDGKAFDDPTVLQVAEKNRKSAAQILGRWCVQHGAAYMPKSVQSSRMRENMDVFDWELNSTDMDSLDSLTTPEAIEKFKELYIKCCIRDTELDPSTARQDFTKH